MLCRIYEGNIATVYDGLIYFLVIALNFANKLNNNTTVFLITIVVVVVAKFYVYKIIQV